MTLITPTNESLRFDTVDEVTYRLPAMVSEHPIEASASITDHRQKQLENFTLVGTVSNSPILLPQFVVQPDDENERIKQAMEFFRTHENELFTWVGPRLGVVNNVLIKSISAPINNAGSIVFTIECIVARFGSFRFVEVPPERVKRKGLSTKDADGAGGKQAKRPVSSILNRNAGDGILSSSRRIDRVF